MIVSIFFKIATLKLLANTFINIAPKTKLELKEAHHKTFIAVSPFAINIQKFHFHVTKFNSLIFLKYLIASGFANDAIFFIS